MYYKMFIFCSSAASGPPGRAPTVPGSQKQNTPKNKFVKKSYKFQCFVINECLDHNFNYKIDLDLKISSGAFDCLNITSVSPLGCSFVARQGS